MSPNWSGSGAASRPTHTYYILPFLFSPMSGCVGGGRGGGRRGASGVSKSKSVIYHIHISDRAISYVSYIHHDIIYVYIYISFIKIYNDI